MEPDMEYDNEPQTEDFILYDSGPLGSRTSLHIVDGKFIGEYSSDNELSGSTKAARAVLLYMEKMQIFTNVWYVNDHGNTEIINV